ncbi:MAG TPA: DUF6264 family protein [Microbacterium sp.]|uniref:DUF6264 family protein n=1 Tax=Microbacterium sp. TaxID=51671 RepID=UPI002D151F4A|nr:DUF6264 family protein [Microbacterium sp.]HWI32528.1 DUF6264 family protein [Microbacterium sp.]
MSDPIERPRPQYGEYATPEEQRARIQQPDATWALEQGQAVTEEPASSAADPKAGAAAPVARAAAPGNVVDRVITIALLGYGLFAVVSSLATLLDFSTFADTWMGMVGIEGEFTNVASGRLWGTVAAVAFVIGWVVTAVLTWRRLRSGRLSFWVPLAGAAVSYVALTALLMIPLLGDPAIIQYLTPAG